MKISTGTQLIYITDEDDTTSVMINGSAVVRRDKSNGILHIFAQGTEIPIKVAEVTTLNGSPFSGTIDELFTAIAGAWD